MLNTAEHVDFIVDLFSFDYKIGDLIFSKVSVHECGKHFVNEVRFVFQSVDMDGLLAIPVMQRSDYELVNFGEEIDKHKDDLLENVRPNIIIIGDLNVHLY